MFELHIPDELYAEVQRVAAESGLSEDALIHEAVAAHLEQWTMPEEPLTGDQIEHLRKSYDQASRGELVEGEAVMANFSEWLKATAQR